MRPGQTLTAGWIALAVVAGGCGGSGPSESAPGAPPAEPPTPAPAAPVVTTPPPAVRLVWLPGGQLALENVDQQRVSLQRSVAVVQASEAGALGEGAAGAHAPDGVPMVLAVDCSTADTGCVSLTPGAAIALGGWPDQHGRCRCPPCADIPGAPAPPAPSAAAPAVEGAAAASAGEDAALALALRSCDAQHVVLQQLPSR